MKTELLWLTFYFWLALYSWPHCNLHDSISWSRLETHLDQGLKDRPGSFCDPHNCFRSICRLLCCLSTRILVKYCCKCRHMNEIMFDPQWAVSSGNSVSWMYFLLRGLLIRWDHCCVGHRQETWLLTGTYVLNWTRTPALIWSHPANPLPVVLRLLFLTYINCSYSVPNVLINL